METGFLVLTSLGLIGGLTGYGLPATVGNPSIKPERLNDDGDWTRRCVPGRSGMRLEATYYNRKLTDLLVRPQIAQSTGVNATCCERGRCRPRV
jgi:hypothetical protein